jgi:hypothetical protein
MTMLCVTLSTLATRSRLLIQPARLPSQVLTSKWVSSLASDPNGLRFQHLVDGGPAEPRHPRNGGNLLPHRSHFVDGGNLVISYPPPPTLLRSTPFLAPTASSFHSKPLKFCHSHHILVMHLSVALKTQRHCLGAALAFRHNVMLMPRWFPTLKTRFHALTECGTHNSPLRPVSPAYSPTRFIAS